MKAVILFNLFGILLKCKAQVYISSAQVTSMEFDYIITGGGSAGAVVASRLSEEGSLKVLLLEAGDKPGFLTYPPGAFLLNSLGSGTWQYPIEPQTAAFFSFPNQQFHYAQGKSVGGTSNINGMMYVRGSKYDYDNWASMGLDGWSYDDVLPYFIKAEGNTIPGEMEDTEYHGTSGPLTVSRLRYQTSSLNNFLAAAAENGLLLTDYNAENQTGSSPIDFTMRNGSRCSTYTAYINTPEVKPNLYISTNSIVTKIIFNQKNATGVQVLINGLNVTARATREIILSAGSLASPKILMHSGIGPANQLQQFNIPLLVDRPGVGQNLQDHIGCIALIWKLNCTNCSYEFLQALSIGNILDYFLHAQGPLTSPSGIEGVLFAESGFNKPDWPDLEMVYASESFANFGILQTLFTEIEYKVLEQYYAPFVNSPNTFTIIPWIIQPESVGYVRLNSSDPTAYPTVNFNFLTAEKDVLTLIQGMKIAKAIGDSYAFKSIGAEFINSTYPGCECYELYSDEYWNCTVRSMNYLLYHPAGTCKMGLANDTMAVVDSQLRVFGVNNLRVADASIMPKIVSGNTNAPSIMFGEKIAALIRDALQQNK